ncbi:hypothetical protein [Niabella hibiscisoli]|nr:hypothetical protein [Niabella hibiscisoli]
MMKPPDIAALLDSNGLFEKTITLERGDFLKKEAQQIPIFTI